MSKTSIESTVNLLLHHFEESKVLSKQEVHEGLRALSAQVSLAVKGKVHERDLQAVRRLIDTIDAHSSSLQKDVAEQLAVWLTQVKENERTLNLRFQGERVEQIDERDGDLR